jgi:hypothetical protein
VVSDIDGECLVSASEDDAATRALGQVDMDHSRNAASTWMAPPATTSAVCGGFGSATTSAAKVVFMSHRRRSSDVAVTVGKDVVCLVDGVVY